MGACGFNNVTAIEADYHIQYNRNGFADLAVGEGSFAKVNSASHKKTNEIRAVKSIDKVHPEIRARVMEEARILRIVSGQHDAIIQFYESYEEWNVMHLVFEYANKGTVQRAVKAGEIPPAGQLCASLAKQLFDALQFLHFCNILHRDVKPENLLLTADMTLKLTDFGVACECLDEELLTASEGTPAFFSPEIYLLPRGKGYLYPADVWAAGVSLYMMVFEDKHPFLDAASGKVSLTDLKLGEFTVGWMTNAALQDLLKWLMMPHPMQRITSREALGHPWFASFGLGPGDFTKERPNKSVPDSHGNWHRYE